MPNLIFAYNFPGFQKFRLVPLLKISAQDDFLVFGPFSKKLNHCLENPNVLVVKTRCGGHLGWQESPPLSSKKSGEMFGGSGSWSNVAVADFIEALLQIREEDRERRQMERQKQRQQLRQSQKLHQPMQSEDHSVQTEMPMQVTKHSVMETPRLPIVLSRL